MTFLKKLYLFVLFSLSKNQFELKPCDTCIKFLVQINLGFQYVFSFEKSIVIPYKIVFYLTVEGKSLIQIGVDQRLSLWNTQI